MGLRRGTIVAWEYLLDWMAWRFPATRPYLKPPSLTLIRDGRLIPQNLRKEMITEDELKSQLREQSVDNYEDIKLATLERQQTVQRFEKAKRLACCSAGRTPEFAREGSEKLAIFQTSSLAVSVAAQERPC